MAENSSCSSASSCSRESCEGCPSKAKGGNGIAKEPMNPSSNVKKVIGVVSGKGGVGKSFVTASLACAMKQAGYKVGIMDADITGPSIPKMLGVHGQVVGTEEGTGDVPLTVFQSLPVDGIVIVTSPQELVQMIVKKAYNMAEMMHVPVLGLIENFSYLKCPDCGREIKLFGESHIEDVAAELTLPVFGKIPLDPAFAEKADEGKFYDSSQSTFCNEPYHVK